MSFIICDLFLKSRRPEEVRGECANCGIIVFESIFTLDDAYAVWLGRCPKCGALNFLDQTGKHGLRGYGFGQLFLVLPCIHEQKMNDLPAGIPLRQCECKEATDDKRRRVGESVEGDEA